MSNLISLSQMDAESSERANATRERSRNTGLMVLAKPLAYTDGYCRVGLFSFGELDSALAQGWKVINFAELTA